MAATVIPMPKFMAFSDAGAPLSAGLVYTYAAGTTTPLATYSDSDLTTPNANPVVLDSAGRATIYLTASSYKIVLKNSAGATVYTQDNIIAAAPYNVDLDVPIVAGEALTAGQAIYLSDGTGSRTAGRWYLTDSDTAAYSTTVITGFVTTALALGEEGSVRLLGQATVPGPLSVGLTYYLSGTPGAIGTTAGTFVKNMGMADSTTTLIMTVATPVTPGGSNTQVQFNDAGVLGGDSGFTFIKATDAVAIGGPLAVTGATTLSSTVATGALTVTGAATVSTTLGVTGATTLSSTVATGALTVTGAATVSTTLGVTGATTLSSTLGVTGLITSTGGITGGAASHTTGAFSSTVTGGTYNSQTISSAANFTGSLGVAGLLTVSGFGTHSFSAGGTGGNIIAIRNTTAGTGNYALLRIGNDASSDLAELYAFSSTYTTNGPFAAGAVALRAPYAGGLNLVADNASGAIRFYSGGTTLRWTIDSAGSLFTGTVAAGTNHFYVAGSDASVQCGKAGTASAQHIGFVNNNGEVGTIKTSGSATAYNTSSDQRLKRDVAVATTTDILRRTVIHDFDWIADGSRARGVFAQEVYAVAPFAVSVGNDEMKDGQLAKPWSVDYSKFVPDLIVGWQQHDTIISQLAARIAALETKDH